MLRSIWNQWRRFFKALFWTGRRSIRLAFRTLWRALTGRRGRPAPPSDEE